MRWLVTGWLLVFGLAVLVAGPPAGASGPSLDAHYRAKANAICRTFGRWTPPPGSATVNAASNSATESALWHKLGAQACASVQ